MALTPSEILDQADLLVPNAFEPGMKAKFFTDCYTEFFEVVKMPAIYQFDTVAGEQNYDTTVGGTNPIRGYNIMKVQVDNGFYPSFVFEEISPGSNYHVLSDAGYLLTLTPAPITDGKGIIKYYRVATGNFSYDGDFLYGDLESPPEYHWIFIIGVAAKIAKAIPDVNMANFFTQEYQECLAVAQQNFRG